MYPHHEKALENLKNELQKEGKFPACIVTGSIAKGLSSEGSNINLVLIASDEEYEKREKRESFMYFNDEISDYEGLYADGRIVNYEYMKQLAERGPEPQRDYFGGAVLLYSEIDGLAETLKKIPVYQVKEKKDKIMKFVAQLDTAYWYMKEAVRRDNKYLMLHSARDLVLYGGRLILAHNEILYPYHKLFMLVLEKAPEKPDDMMQLIDDLVSDPNNDTATAFYRTITKFRKWETSLTTNSFTRFMLDTEMAWFDGKMFVGDL